MTTLIFDLTTTLFYQDPLTFFRVLWKNKPVAARVCAEVFSSEEWGFLEEGTITDAEAEKWITARAPADIEVLRFVLDHWAKCLTPRWDVAALLLDLKEQGSPLYFVGGLPERGRDFVLQSTPFVGLFDGGLFSCDEHLRGADYRFLQNLCAKYRFFDPSELAVLSQNPNLLAAAEVVGMKPHKFVSAARTADVFLL